MLPFMQDYTCKHCAFKRTVLALNFSMLIRDTLPIQTALLCLCVARIDYTPFLTYPTHSVEVDFRQGCDDAIFPKTPSFHSARTHTNKDVAAVKHVPSDLVVSSPICACSPDQLAWCLSGNEHHFLSS